MKIYRGKYLVSVETDCQKPDAQIRTSEALARIGSMGVIYLIRNTVNGKVYVGQAQVPLKKRRQSHVCYAKKGSDFRLHRAIRKYGCGAFTIEPLDVAGSAVELDLKETRYIARFNSGDCARVQHGNRGRNIPCASARVHNEKEYKIKGAHVFGRDSQEDERCASWPEAF